MVSWLPHIVVPCLLALWLLPVERWRTLAWAPIVWLQDADYLLPGEHRVLTHTLWPPLLLVAFIGLKWRLRDPTADWREYVTRPGLPANLLLAAYYLFSHSFLDVFQGGVVLFWPILDTNFFLGFEIWLDTKTNQLMPETEAGTSEGAPGLAPLYPWLSATDGALLAFLVVVGAAWLALRMVRVARGPAAPRPVVFERKAVRDDPAGPRAR